MIKVGIIGATGYAGAELLRLLAKHPEVEVIKVGSKSYAGEEFASLFGNMRGFCDTECDDVDLAEYAKECDLIFTATPQGYLGGILNKDILQNVKIIDLSADYRLKDVAIYEEWYKIEHKSPELLPDAVYGLCEINRETIKDTALLANPGCYTTCSILSSYPLVKEGIIDPNTIIIDAKSGTSGAGRGAKMPNLYCEVNENVKAYGVLSHRHTPEIEEQLSYAAGENIKIIFTPHLIPMNRGILVTGYANLKKSVTKEEVMAAYEKHYKDERFIRLLPYGMCPETRWVEGSNYTDISFKLDERTNRIVFMAALDNLVKGAAGQAVQNMNIMFGFKEDTGIDAIPMFP